MSAIPPGHGGQPPSQETIALPQGGDADRIARQWLALHRAALLIAELAGAEEDCVRAGLPATVLHSAVGQRRLFEDGLGDIVAIVEPGLTALLAIAHSGGDARSAARALWQEFIAARAALLALAEVG